MLEGSSDEQQQQQPVVQQQQRQPPQVPLPASLLALQPALSSFLASLNSAADAAGAAAARAADAAAAPVVAAPEAAPPANAADGAAQVEVGVANHEGAQATAQQQQPQNEGAEDDDGDLEVVWQFCEELLPFVLVASCALVFLYRYGFLIAFWLFGVANYLDQIVRQQVSLRGDCSYLNLVKVVLLSSNTIFVVYFIFRDECLWKALILLWPNDNYRIVTALWICIVNDFAVRLGTMLLKALAVCCLHRGTRSRVSVMYDFIEVTSHLYRLVLVSAVWARYFYMNNWGETPTPYLSVGLAFSYMFLRGYVLLPRLREWLRVTRACVTCGGAGLQRATEEEVTRCSNTCPICQDAPTDPVVLPCHHVFCEECISEWLAGQKTCPMCRDAIASGGYARGHNGHTSSCIALV
eukprot:TRINITY_DN119_c0_g1_i5.p1 TRINITY_DN119_c0_g1~~TRINITY_DN119_c0_g1_i5.p1  ORF type:complete len:409 (-),score=113.66 TRINITY_DN119_c0_g1_i5:77-1303(-)